MVPVHSNRNKGSPRWSLYPAVSWQLAKRSQQHTWDPEQERKHSPRASHKHAKLSRAPVALATTRTPESFPAVLGTGGLHRLCSQPRQQQPASMLPFTPSWQCSPWNRLVLQEDGCLAPLHRSKPRVSSVLPGRTGCHLCIHPSGSADKAPSVEPMCD